jgi:hypothetical protein
VTETTQQLFADLIDAFNKAWSRPETWNAGQIDEKSSRIREIWALERDRWTVNLLDLIRTWLLWPQDDPDAADETGLPSWAQNIAQFKKNMTAGAESAELRLLRAIEGLGGDGEGT